MRNLKDKIINEMKIIGVNLTPFVCFNNKAQKFIYNARGKFGKDKGFLVGDFGKRDTFYTFLNICGSWLSVLAIGIHIYSSLSFEAPMFSDKWKQNRKEWINENQIREHTQKQNYYRKQFQQLDKNKDYVVDSTEFIYRR